MLTAWIPPPVEVLDYWTAALKAQNQRGEAGRGDVPQATPVIICHGPLAVATTGHAQRGEARCGDLPRAKTGESS